MFDINSPHIAYCNNCFNIESIYVKKQDILCTIGILSYLGETWWMS